MAQGRSSPIWATSRMSPVGKTTPSSIAGVVTRPADRKPGRSSASGSGTSDSNWGIGLCQNRCARPSLPLLFHHNRNQLSPVRARLLSKLPPRGTLHLPPRHPGRLAASPAPTFHSNRMEPCDVPQAACWSRMSTVENSMGACGWLFCEHSRLPSVPVARTLPMERQRHAQTAPSQRAAPSLDRGIGSAAVAGLEPATSAAGVSASASPTPGHPERVKSSPHPDGFPSDNFSGPAGALPFVLE